MHKKDRQIPPHARLAQSNIHVFSGYVAFLHFAEKRFTKENLVNFFRLYIMFPGKFVNDVRLPNDVYDPHGNIIPRTRKERI